MKTALNTITLYYSILRMLEITVLRICFSIFVNGSMSRDGPPKLQETLPCEVYHVKSHVIGNK